MRSHDGFAMTTRRRFILGSCAVAAAGGGGGAAFLNTAQFGRPPSAARRARILASPNWKNGCFRNAEPFAPPRAQFRENRLKIWWKFLFADKTALSPSAPLEIVKPDFAALAAGGDCAVWLGHSSVFLRLDGVNVVFDPVFSPYASPLPFVNRAFRASAAFALGDLPDIDILAISHDHWDHLDYPTVHALIPRVKYAVCPLGVGEYLEQWGMPPDRIFEGDWFDEFNIANLHWAITPARHFSGRLSRMNGTLWGGFALRSSKRAVFFSGDGGWGRHFAEIARRFAPFDFAFMENGQYNVRWPSVHSHPPETAAAAELLRARFLVPIHNSKFALSDHRWNEPMDALAALAPAYSWKLAAQPIGRPILFDAPPDCEMWWKCA